jgi:hypothetical protein
MTTEHITLFYAYLLPIILITLMSLFLRTCVRLKGGKKIPRILPLTLIPASFLPLLGAIIALMMIFTVAGNLTGGSWTIVDNKFTRFWLND